MNEEPNKTVKDSPPTPISSTTPGAGEDLLQAGVMQAPDQPGMLGKIGRFDVIKVLGQGGMGEVLLAREPATNVKVAIKVLKPQLAQDTASVHRFVTEARHAYGMSHPNILKVLEVSDSADRPFYVVPYIEGGSLARRICPQKPLTTETALDIARQVAQALHYAHGRGIIHRDLKPANVLMDSEGHAYLTDFGLLRTVFNDSFVDVQQSSLEGTAPYMSPAVVAGKAEDTRCDIYSFGAMLYEMLTGQPPYTGPSVDIILKKVAAGPPEPLLKLNPKASKELAAIADWAMARELRDRYATMSDVLSDLERVAKGKEPVGPHGVAGLSRQSRRNLAIAGAAVVVMAMVAFVLSKMTPSSKTGMSGEAAQKIDLTSGLVAHFPLDGHVRDVTGNGHDGVIRGNVRYVNGPIGQAIDLDGSAWVMLPDEKFLDGVSNATIALWFFSRADGFYRTAFACADGGSHNVQVVLDCGPRGLNQCGFRDMVAGASIYAPQLASCFQNQKWHFIAMTLEVGPKLTTLRVYLDGELQGMSTANMAVPIRYDRPMPAMIGTVGYNNWIGSLDDVRIYNRTLSPAEIQKLFRNGTPPPPPAAPAVAPPAPGTPPTAPPGMPGFPARAVRPGMIAPPTAPGIAAPPPQPPALSLEDRLARRAFAARAQNLITNGGFDLGPLGPDGSWRQVLLPGSTQLPGWTIIENHVLRNLDNTDRAIGDTNNYFWLSLNGYSAVPPFGGVAQTITTEIGKAYRLSLVLGAWNEPGDSVPGGCSVLVSAGSTNASFTNTTSERGIGVNRTYSFVFVAEADKTSITIRGKTGRNCIGLDNVSVEPWIEKPGNGASAQPGAGTDWRSLLKQADATYAENRYDEAIKLYDTALGVMEQDQTTDATILKTMKAAALKHRGLASFIPQRDKLPADKQVEALHTKLRELNPNYNGKGTFTIRAGKIVEASLSGLDLADISPLKGLPLSNVDIGGTRVQDLSPLRGMPLQHLGCTFTPIADLSPLKGMRLIGLDLHQHRGAITDLSPLQGMPLEWFSVWGSPVKDLSPLKGMPLKFLCISDCLVEDLSPLQGMPLESIEMVGTPVSDFSPLRKCPLKGLCARGGRGRDLTSLKGLALQGLEVPANVTDLSPLAGMQIGWLAINAPGVTDLGPLKGMPLTHLFIRATNIKTGWEVIRQMPTLKVIVDDANTGGNQPAAEFWKRFDAGEFSTPAR